MQFRLSCVSAYKALVWYVWKDTVIGLMIGHETKIPRNILERSI